MQAGSEATLPDACPLLAGSAAASRLSSFWVVCTPFPPSPGLLARPLLLSLGAGAPPGRRSAQEAEGPAGKVQSEVPSLGPC